MTHGDARVGVTVYEIEGSFIGADVGSGIIHILVSVIVVRGICSWFKRPGQCCGVEGEGCEV